MRAIMVMFDTLNRRMLPPYGCEWIHAPNFERLAQRTVTFDNCYIGSAPCMPARRELHTGRYNFLHRGWGPLEPFDDSMPKILSQAGIHTHLVSDHYHYWEAGGATYHTSYDTWEFVRGQEGDPWKGQVSDPEIPDNISDRSDHFWRQDWVNREHMPDEDDHFQTRTFDRAQEFIQTNHDADNWFLQVEAFDPHEPFFTHQTYKDLYPHDYEGSHFDWPSYRRVHETPDQISHLRYEYAALVSMCDHSLGRVLDMMDEFEMWEDTLLIVNTDHGFLLGEHDWWAKCVQPFYNEVAHIPLFIWDPRSGKSGERRQALVQTIDTAPTLLDFFGLSPTEDMQGFPLRDTIATDARVREAALFGIYGGHINVTDGSYVYLRAPEAADNRPLYHYTLLPTHMREMFSVEELQNTELADPLPFSKGCPVLKIEGYPLTAGLEFQSELFDLRTDPEQRQPLDDATAEQIMIEYMRQLLLSSDAPRDQYQRMGLRNDQDT